MIQTTLVILKPDAVQRGLMGEIIKRIEAKGLKIVAGKFMQITPELAGKHYAVHQGKPFYDGLVKFMTSAPVMVLAVHGNHAVEVVRAMMGPTKAYTAPAGTIRGDFGSSHSFNLIHGSDAPETAEQEIKLFFKEGELFPHARATDDWVVDMTSGQPQ